MALDPLTTVFEVGKTVLERVLPAKMNEEERTKVANDFTVEMAKVATAQDNGFQRFILEYEGGAKDVPRGVVLFRSFIRPLFTCAVAWWNWLYFANTAPWEPE